MKVVNPDATFTTKTYNAMNQVASATDERGFTTTYTYHASGLLHQLTDPRNNTYTHIYDASGKITSRTYPGGSQEQWQYDAAGNVSAYFNRSNQRLAYTYDNRNRETLRAWDGNVAPSVSTGYDATGRVTSRSNANSSLGYGFDAAGRLTSQTQAPTGGASITLAFTYDADGRRRTFDGAGGRQLAYHYNGRGELDALRLGTNPDSGTALATFSYNLAGQRTGRQSGNGIQTTYGHDAAGRLNYLNAAGVLRQDFGHDLRDRRIWTLRDQNLGDTYTYFADSQLNVYRHSVSRPDLNFNNPAAWTDTFNYDGAGNRTSWNENGTTTSYTADALNQYSAVSGNSGGAIAHDARGNVTTWGGQTLGYDADNRLTSVTQSGLTLTFAYDPEGRLVKLVKNGAAEYRFYDGAQVFLRTDGNGTAIDWTVWGPTPDEVIARHVSGAWQFYHQDQINSVYAVTNSGGSVLERYLYDPFGLPDVRSASWTSLGTGSAISNPWLFTGQEWRSDIQLANYKARWYQPTLGRFMQTDPVRFDAGDINLYRYCSNDPVNRLDPTGEIGLWGAAIGAAIDVGFQLYRNGGDITKIDPISVGVSALAGATGAGLGQVIAKNVAQVGVRIVANAAANGAVSGVAQATENIIKGNDVMDGVIQAATVGSVSGAMGGVVSEIAGAGADTMRKLSAEAAHDGASLATRQMASSTAHDIAGAARSNATQVTNSISSATGVAASTTTEKSLKKPDLK